ncbi:MAG: YMGG-like glycine zipper-containing protein [Alphaproteobacteria bacterium]
MSTTACLRVIGLCAGTLLLAACGSSPTDRALSGGGIGAGAGAAAGALTGGSPITGAIIGGAAGAAAGALTDEDDVNLGKPAWR